MLVILRKNSSLDIIFMTQSYKRETEMPITVQWLDDSKEILYENFIDPWTLADYHWMVDQAAEHLATVPHTVHIICDSTQSKVLPANMLAGARYASKKRSRNEGSVYFVRANRFAQTVVTMAQTIFPNLNNLYFAETLEDAVQMIQARIEAEKTKA